MNKYLSDVFMVGAVKYMVFTIAILVAAFAVFLTSWWGVSYLIALGAYFTYVRFVDTYNEHLFWKNRAEETTW